MDSSDEEQDFEDEDALCKYGTALTPYEADEIPSKKPIQIEDQIVKDENGRRRFHGAFTGGFSAGYWNTVGSKEGFTPSEFKSSRSEKGRFTTAKPSDFMDEEDMSEFGFAPHKIQTKEDFGSGSNKRKFERPSEGPIPGEPVLKNLLKPAHDKAAVRILKSMGWRDNQGIGARQSYKEKRQANKRNQRELYIQKTYGCDVEAPPAAGDSDDEFSDEEITFAPDDFDPYIANVKDNSFGLGYSGLQPSTSQTSQHVNLFQAFEVVGKNNKKLSIRGQAFGVGALEEEDDDIYAQDDMSNYDKSLEDAKKSKKKSAPRPQITSLIEGFSKSSFADSSVKTFSVELSRNFIPRNWLQRRSRFTPLDARKARELEEKNKHKVLGLGRHDLKPEERGVMLGEASGKKNESNSEKHENSTPLPTDPPPSTSKMSIPPSPSPHLSKIQEFLSKDKFVSEHKGTFKPFLSNPEKQSRYEKFLDLKSSNEEIISKLLKDIQPLSMWNFDREMEKKEFIQARKMFQPLDSLIADRFIKEVEIEKNEKQMKTTDTGKQILVIQRTKAMWKPHKNLCKRFNVPEPFGGMMFDEEEEKKKKKKSSSLFDYIGVPLNTKQNFVTPQVIPRNLQVDDRKKTEEDERRKNFLAAVEKEKSFMTADPSKRLAAKDFFEEKTVKESPVVEEVRKEPEPPKTELERKVAESIDKKPEEKKDLFKAIFCDSDDEDEEKGDAAAPASLSETQKSTFIESFLNTKSASEINVLRNDEAPRGIFKNILQVSSVQEKKSSEEKKGEVPAEDETEAYGPKLPENLQLSRPVSVHDDSSSSSESSLDEKLLKKLKKAKKHKDEWVEKDKISSKKKKKKEKHKKKKSKKHKSRK